MDEIVIKKHNFDLAKKRLERCLNSAKVNLEIKAVPIEGGLFDLFDHTVTGEELNERLNVIQKLFISVNKNNNKVFEELREVYNLFDFLDKEYITSIIANIKAVNKTSEDVRVQQKNLKEHNEKLEHQQSKLDEHQIEIEKIVENNSKTIEILKIFNEKLKECEHLSDIDKIWNDYNAISEKRDEDLATIQKNREEVEIKIESAIQKADRKIEFLAKKIKYSYWIAGGAVGLAVIDLFLLLR